MGKEYQVFPPDIQCAYSSSYKVFDKQGLLSPVLYVQDVTTGKRSSTFLAHCIYEELQEVRVHCVVAFIWCSSASGSITVEANLHAEILRSKRTSSSMYER